MKLAKCVVLIAVLALVGGAMSWAAEGPVGDPAVADADQGTIGRPVRIISIGQCNKSPKEMAELVDREAATGADLIVVPEIQVACRR